MIELLRPSSNKDIGMQQPMAFPNLRCLPACVSGMPIALEILDFAAETPSALFQEKETPGIRNLGAILRRRLTVSNLIGCDF